jgi:hypothetical protein
MIEAERPKLKFRKQPIDAFDFLEADYVRTVLAGEALDEIETQPH